MPIILSTMVEVCVFRFSADHPEYLLLKRAPGELLYPNIWQMVTGSIEVGETAVVAALREVQEETSLTPQRFWVVPWANTFHDRRRDAIQITPMFAVQVPPEADAVLSREHNQSAWLRYPTAERRLVWPGQRRGLEIVHRYIVAGEEAARLGEVPAEEWMRRFP
jgi:8-oxo-dGTP pyrophosphatase MutT (NUDIX family)